MLSYNLMEGKYYITLENLLIRLLKNLHIMNNDKFRKKQDVLLISNFDKFLENDKILKKLEVIKMNENKTNINWYPGHMAKTRRKITAELQNIDIVYEVIDARIPYSSKIKDIDSLIKNKKRILIMTKKDLCDLKVTQKWVEYYEKLGYTVLLVDLKEDKDYKKVITSTYEITKAIQAKRLSKGLKEKTIRAVVIGVPNVGKSTLINKMTGKKSVSVENRPGVTKDLNYLKTDLGIVLLDTPGILWPKLEEEKVALNLAATGSIKKEVLNIDEICVYILNTLTNLYPHLLEERYGVTQKEVLEIYAEIAKKIGAFQNNEIDYEKVSNRVYNDLISGNIRNITLDVL